ncbi:NAD(P)-binding protein [Wilcoxina mikolae CBS 423.85]|nr:NAD(P)-binding protein [Wilcoxina mikolae CBS 423.85]
MSSADSPPQPPPPLPKPKTYLLTSSLTPLGHALSLHLLSQGATLAACCTRTELTSPVLPLLRSSAPDPTRLIILELDPMVPSTIQSALATAATTFGRLDVVVHTGIPTYLGALEELSSTDITGQFEIGYFGRVAVVKSALSVMRRQRGGHIVVVTGLTGAMGTPGMAVRCAADHAIEGMLDALAFEVAPFAVRVSVVQPSVEVAVWGGGEVQCAEGREEYAGVRQVSAVRGMVGRTLGEGELEDTVRIIAEIAGVENPPGRVTVGEEGVEMVKERLKTLSEELEEYLEASLGADISAPPGQAPPAYLLSLARPKDLYFSQAKKGGGVPSFLDFLAARKLALRNKVSVGQNSDYLRLNLLGLFVRPGPASNIPLRE